MQGTSQYKTCCGKYKQIGDDIQTDTIADDRYTWDFYFRNELVNKKWINKGLSPMHACLLHIFENFCDSFHVMNKDDLFNSKNFTIKAERCKLKVLTQSTKVRPWSPILCYAGGNQRECCRKGKVYSEGSNIDGRRSCNWNYCCLCRWSETIFHDHKCHNFSCVEVGKKVWSDKLVSMLSWKFCCSAYLTITIIRWTIMILQIKYGIMRFSRFFKWWWTLWLWGFEETIVNACMM